ncbi:hypothetical protein STANM309S_04950 [Streptomyces tanashiensis]
MGRLGVDLGTAGSRGGSESGGYGAAYDYAVLHVKPEQGSASLEETVGAALDVDFSGPPPPEAGTVGAWGYPAALPYNGLRMFQVPRHGRGPVLARARSLPDMYRIGCTMTGGSSGGGWFRVAGGETVLVSNTSIGPLDHTWLAGPRLGPDAEALYQNMSRTPAAVEPHTTRARPLRAAGGGPSVMLRGPGAAGPAAVPERTARTPPPAPRAPAP